MYKLFQDSHIFILEGFPINATFTSFILEISAAAVVLEVHGIIDVQRPVILADE